MGIGVQAAVILAAGASSRMGGETPKALLQFRGMSFLRRAIETARAVPVDEVVVVLGSHAEAMLPEIPDGRVTVVVNDQWAEGLSSSLRGGLSAVSPDARGAFVFPADMPLVTVEMLRTLYERQQASGRPAAVTDLDGVIGVPVYVTRNLFPPLMIQDGDSGGSQYLRAHPDLVEAVTFADAEALRDIDRPEDYQRLLALDEEPVEDDSDLPAWLRESRAIE